MRSIPSHHTILKALPAAPPHPQAAHPPLTALPLRRKRENIPGGLTLEVVIEAEGSVDAATVLVAGQSTVLAAPEATMVKDLCLWDLMASTQDPRTLPGPSLLTSSTGKS